MAILKLLTLTNPILRQLSRPVGEINSDIKLLLKDMQETILDSHAAGLAAVQVGFLKRIMAVDLSLDERDNASEPNILFLINPEIIEYSENKVCLKEGCLSIPEQWLEIARPEKVKVKYLDFEGKEKIIEASGMVARCILHEIDHLNGILMVDYLSPLKKQMVTSKVIKLEKRHR